MEEATWGGLIPALLGVDILAATSIDWITRGGEDLLGFRSMLQTLAIFLVGVGLFVLLCLSSGKRRDAMNQLWIAVVMFLLLMGWIIVIPPLGKAAVESRQAADMAANAEALIKVVELVDGVLERHGSAPEKEELEGLLAEPLPSVRWHGYAAPMHYERRGEDTYELWYIEPYGFFGDIMHYHSNNPQQGWLREDF